MSTNLPPVDSSAGYDLTPVTQLTRVYKDIPAACLVDVALGLESPEKILRRYEIDDASIPALLAFKPFQLQVERCRAELQTSGVVFRTKNALLADQLQHQIYKAASDPATPLVQKLDAYKTFAKFGGLEPTPATQAGQGQNAGGITLNISFGSAKPRTPLTIEAEPQTAPTATPAPAFSLAHIPFGGSWDDLIVEETA